MKAFISVTFLSLGLIACGSNSNCGGSGATLDHGTVSLGFQASGPSYVPESDDGCAASPSENKETCDFNDPEAQCETGN